LISLAYRDKPAFGENEMTEGTPRDAPPRRKINPTLKFALELGPLVVFFAANWKFKLFVATGALMVAVVAALVISFALMRRLPIMPLVTAIIVIIFGSLTFYFQNDAFIKMKPTALYLLFSGALLGGLAFGKLLLPVMFDSAFQITEEGWQKLTYRWAIFFLAMAVLNEIVWRNTSPDFWVNFKSFGVIPLTMLFGLAQAPLIMRHEAKDAPNDAM
jgi:intracellular septation protein